MAGRTSKSLRRADIKRLEAFRMDRRLSFPQLKLTMDAPFKWDTLKRAMEGESVWDVNYHFIVNWLDEHLPADQPKLDFKASAAGDAPESPEATDEAQPAEHARLRSGD